MKQHSIIAIIGLIFAILAICCFILSFILPWGYETNISGNEYVYETSIYPLLCIVLTIIFSVLAIIFGATSYWGRWKDKLGLTDFIIGLVVVIIWFFIWIVIYTFSSGMLYGVPSYKPKVR